MTENPSTNLGNYDLLAERGQQGISFSSNTAGTGEGLKTSSTRPRGPFTTAANEKPKKSQELEQSPAAYNDQSFFAKFLINILMMLTGKLDANNQGNNPLIGMISKAFGMNDDANHTEFRELQNDIKTRGRTAARDSRDYSKFNEGAAVQAAKMGEPVLGKNIYNSQMLELIGKGESGGDYNRVYGKAKRIDLTNMTINEVVAWQKDYTSNQGSASSAAGKYQVIRKTLEASVREMGLSGNEKFDPAMQDKIAKHLLDKRGYTAVLEGRMSEEKFANNAASEWASLKKTNGRGAYDGDGLNAGKISAGQTIGATRQDKTIMASFNDAGSGAPKPPATETPIIVASNTPTPESFTPRRPAAAPGVPAI